MNRYVRPLSIINTGTCNDTSGYLCGTFQSNCAVLLRYPNGSSKVTERYFEGTVTVLQRYRNGTSRVTKRYGTVLQRYYDGSTFTVTGTFVDFFFCAYCTYILMGMDTSKAQAHWNLPLAIELGRR